MSHTRLTASSSSSFRLIFDDALKAYKKRAKKDLLSHPLATQLQACDSPASILALLHNQVQDFNQSRNNDERLFKWLDPMVNVLYALSATLGEGVGLVFSPAKVIFAGVGVLLLAAKDVRASQDTLVDIFERIECFFRRLETYTEVPVTPEMTDIIIQIMVEVLSILGIATSEMKDGRMRKYAKKLVGRTDLEDALHRLDKLTQEEARMATTEVLKVTHTVDKNVRGVSENMVTIDHRVDSVDDRVAGVREKVDSIDNKVANVDNTVVGIDGKMGAIGESVAGIDRSLKGIDTRVAGVHDSVRAVDEKVTIIIDDGNKAKQVIQQTVNDLDQVKHNQLRESIHKWLSPPDPSTNHNIAYGTHHKGTAAWFFQGGIFKEWKTSGSLLWIHGKPGSGKSVLCSTIIEDIRVMCEAGQASMAYFYFDFQNINKQHLRDLIRSLLIQLSAHSDSRCDILLHLHDDHDSGKMQPSDNALTRCLKQMLTLPEQRPIYLILDAIDECPDTTGIPSPRERVLQLVKELVELQVPNLRICVTSRPEINIRDVLGSLTSLRVSLHEQSGQKTDIVEYIKSVVYSDSERIMRRWKADDRELVVEMLSERADGMFRWIFCQLEVLRHCLPSSVRRTLQDLPNTLDETYERVLKEIKKPNRDHAHRILQCLVVAVRPLRVEELAEVLAIDFDDSEGIAKLKPSWRWEDEEQALLSSCHSLITIVDLGNSRVVQFSHFSVKEFLTSPRLSTSSGDASRYHIVLEPAHMILAQACLSVLLRSDDSLQNNIRNASPLAGYAAQYWVSHVQFQNVSSYLETELQYMFDSDKPYFAAWLKLHDVDVYPNFGMVFAIFCPYRRSNGSPLYYAALCGLHDLTEHLVSKDPGQVNAHGGYHETPLIAALAGEHFRTAELLIRNGADAAVNLPGILQRTALHSAAFYGFVEVSRFLLKHGADVNLREARGKTPLHLPSEGGGSRKGPDVPRMVAEAARLLLQYGADVNAPRDDGMTPLHVAAECGSVQVARVLLEHGANVDAKDSDGSTAFQVALNGKSVEMRNLFLQHGATTPL